MVKDLGFQMLRFLILLSYPHTTLNQDPIQIDIFSFKPPETPGPCASSSKPASSGLSPAPTTAARSMALTATCFCFRAFGLLGSGCVYTFIYLFVFCIFWLFAFTSLHLLYMGVMSITARSGTS